MDPNIMRLLEEDEVSIIIFPFYFQLNFDPDGFLDWCLKDETMHSGADVEAFQAALNRDIGGDVYSSQPSDSVAGMFLIFIRPHFNQSILFSFL